MICVESADQCFESCQWPDCMVTNAEGRDLKESLAFMGVPVPEEVEQRVDEDVRYWDA